MTIKFVTTDNFEITDKLIDQIVKFDYEIFLSDAYNINTWSSILKDHNKYYKQIIIDKNDNDNDNDNVIGLIIVSKNISEHGIENEYYYIYTLQISEEYRKMGLATKLLKDVLNLQDHKDHKEDYKNVIMSLDVDKDNYNAIKLYEKNGFKCVLENDEQYVYTINL